MGTAAGVEGRVVVQIVGLALEGVVGRHVGQTVEGIRGGVHHVGVKGGCKGLQW